MLSVMWLAASLILARPQVARSSSSGSLGDGAIIPRSSTRPEIKKVYNINIIFGFFGWISHLKVLILPFSQVMVHSGREPSFQGPTQDLRTEFIHFYCFLISCNLRVLRSPLYQLLPFFTFQVNWWMIEM